MNYIARLETSGETERPDGMAIEAAWRNCRRRLFLGRVFRTIPLGLILLGASFAAVPAASAQEHDGDPRARAQSSAAGTGDPKLETEIYEQLARPVVEAYREEFKTAQNPEALKTPLRALVGQIHETVAERLKDQVENRAAVARHVREKFLAEIGALASTPAATATLRKLLEQAVDEDFSTREEHLWSVIMCWCPREKWTRTLSGCPDACADEQKGLVKTWLSEGRTEDEIVELMVAHPKGGEKVRGYLKATGVNRLGYLLPFLFFGGALVVVGFALYRLTARRDGQRPLPESPPGVPTRDDSSEDDATDEDKKWGELVERELKEMDN